MSSTNNFEEVTPSRYQFRARVAILAKSPVSRRSCFRPGWAQGAPAGPRRFARRASLAALSATLAGACSGASGTSAPARPSTPPTETAPVPRVSVPLQPEAAPPSAEPEPQETPAQELDFAGSGDWPVFHGDPARTGASSVPTLTRPRLRWKTRVGIQSWLNSPLVIGAAVIVPSSGSTHNAPDAEDGVVALDLTTGAIAWRASLPNDANGAAATKEQVFVTSDDGHLRALSIETGAQIWQRRGRGKMYTYPLLFGELVVVGDADGFVRAYRRDGSTAFEAQLTGAIRGGASADARQLYVTSQGGDVVALRPDGHVQWRTRVQYPPWRSRNSSGPARGPNATAEIYSPPIVTDDAVVVPFARDTYYLDRPALIAFDKRTGREKWRAQGSGDFANLRPTPALVAGVLVYAEPYSGDVVGISAATGRMLYRHTVGHCYFPQWAAPAAAGDVAYVQRFDGVLHAVRASDGKALWRFYVGDSTRVGASVPRELAPSGGCEWDVPVGHPAYAPLAVARDGTILAGTREGFLYAIEETP